MGLLHGSIERQFVLQIAQNPTMVFGQHWVPSYSSFEPAHSQLQPGKMSPGGAVISDGQAGDPVCQLQSTDISSLGRAAPQVGGVPRLEKSPAASGPPGLAVYRQALVRAGK